MYLRGATAASAGIEWGHAVAATGTPPAELESTTDDAMFRLHSQSEKHCTT